MPLVNTIPNDGENIISKPLRPIERNRYPDIDFERSWELTNLIRIAATDYQYFCDWFKTQQGSENLILEVGRNLKDITSDNSWIFVAKNASRTVINEYFLLSEAEAGTQTTASKFSDSDYYKYRVVKTYEYVSYYPLEARVDIDRFGFIAERKESHRTIVFVVFRGTREPSEWFNNGQFQQVKFLETETNPKGVEDFGQVSLGFNKMYTQFRPGIFRENGVINDVSQYITQPVKMLIEKHKNFNIQEQTVAQAVNDYFSTAQLGNADVYITGHSLGAALATIAAADIARRNNITNPINLYTFACPRVGNNNFCDKFNEFMDRGKIKAFRFANTEDLVPNIPFPVWFKLGLELDQNSPFNLFRSTFDKVTAGVFKKDYQHVGIPVYFTHQARRIKPDGSLDETATLTDNHNLTVTYGSALAEK